MELETIKLQREENIKDQNLLKKRGLILQGIKSGLSFICFLTTLNIAPYCE